MKEIKPVDVQMLSAAQDLLDACVFAFHYISDGEEFSKDHPWNKETTLNLIKQAIRKAGK